MCSYRVNFVLVSFGLQIVHKVRWNVSDTSEPRPMGDLHMLQTKLLVNQSDKLGPLEHGSVQDGSLDLNALKITRKYEIRNPLERKHTFKKILCKLTYTMVQ